MKDKKKKKKIKKLVIIGILVLIVIGLFIFNKVKANKTEEKIEMEAIEKRTIATSISATGTIKTTNTKNITSTLTGMEIKEVKVKEGDKVSIGDVICTFDTSTISDSLATAQEGLNISKAQANLGIQGARRSLDEAISNKGTQVASTQSDINSAKKAYDDSKNQLANLKNSLSEKQQNISNLSQQLSGFRAIENEYNTKKTNLENITNEYNAQESLEKNAEIEYNKYFSGSNQLDVNGVFGTIGAIIDPSQYQIGTEYATAVHQTVALNLLNAKDSLSNLEVRKNNAIAEFNNFEPTYRNATTRFAPLNAQYEREKTEISSLQGNIATLEASTEQLKNTYEKALSGYNTVMSTSDSTIASLRDALSNSELSATSTALSQEAQIKNYKEQLAKGIITSTVNGTVASVGVKKGDIYTGANIATIEGVEDFIVEAQIDEYDIPDISVGMKVFIKTDATREEELEGEVIYVSSIATSNDSMQTTSMTTNAGATYKIQVSINNQNERLRLGMNAKLSIVTDMKENVLSVPYDSIHDEEDGKKYLEIAKDDEGKEIEKINIKTGIEGTYYVEVISNELKEGMKVILPEIDSSDSIDNLIEAMGADAGV